MPARVQIDAPLETLIQSHVATGRVTNANDLIRVALLLLQRQQNVNGRLELSIAEADAGLLIDTEEAFDELDRELMELAARRPS